MSLLLDRQPNFLHGPEHTAKLTPPRSPLEFFQTQLEKVKKTGESLDLATYEKEFPLKKWARLSLGTPETLNPTLPKFSDDEINNDLLVFLTQLTENKNCIAEFNNHICDKPDQYIQGGDYDTKIWRRNIKKQNITLGFRVLINDSEVLSVTWFIEGPKKKRFNLLAKIAVRINPFG